MAATHSELDSESIKNIVQMLNQSEYERTRVQHDDSLKHTIKNAAPEINQGDGIFKPPHFVSESLN